MTSPFKIKATDTTAADLRFLEKAPKAVLYAMCKHLAAAASPEGYETALESGAYLERMRQEWVNLHSANVVPQKPPKALP